ncbi:MAG: UDP-N-acetylmuramoyl-L-alanyl-D-glutamate--2,6-diaminopimelate ligase [Spirochaetaceae bacterium]
MSRLPLSDLLSDLTIYDSCGSPDVEVSGISYDSRAVREGTAFFAIRGAHVDGHDYIQNAVEHGARAIVYTQTCPDLPETVVTVRVGDSREALSAAAAAWHGHPSAKLPCIGITGTDGKSTTVHFLWQLLTQAGYRTGCISTVYLSTGDTLEKNPFRQSTPEAPEIHGILRQMVDNGCMYAVVEATSHGLSPRTHRLSHVEWAGAVFTNLGHEHLEFHGSFEQYRADKCRLFSGLNDRAVRRPFGLVNEDDPSAPWFARASTSPVTRISMSGRNADAQVRAISQTDAGTSFELSYAGEVIRSSIRIPGIYNVFNASAAALAAALVTGTPLPQLLSYAPDLRPPEGRMDEIHAGQPFRVIVDFAHTPGSFEAVLPMLRLTTRFRLIVVFGSAGERDTAKRSMQGAVADRLADLIFLADEDPRGEEPESILRDIARGCERHTEGSDLFLIADRREAIRNAFQKAAAGDTVALLGKGHESSIIYSAGPRPWNESAVAREILHEMGYEA